MKVFISSLISGMEPLRAAVRDAVSSLGHEPVMAEDFGAQPTSPQVACLQGLRQSGPVVLILAGRYGELHASGISATHEEFREARAQHPVLAFVQSNVSCEPAQTQFINEVQNWSAGLFRDSFFDADDLRRKVILALHRQEISTATAPFNAHEVFARAIASFSSEQRSYSRSEPYITFAIAGGPSQTILRPTEIEAPDLAEKIEKEALFGSARIFSRGEPSSNSIESGKLYLQQGERSSRLIQLDSQGGILINLPVGNDQGKPFGHSVILAETVIEKLTTALQFVVWLLDEIDPTQRLTHLVIAAKMVGGLTLLTRGEFEASPNSIRGAGFNNDESAPVHLDPPHIPRPALKQNGKNLVEDLSTLLRRQRNTN